MLQVSMFPLPKKGDGPGKHWSLHPNANVGPLAEGELCCSGLNGSIQRSGVLGSTEDVCLALRMEKADQVPPIQVTTYLPPGTKEPPCPWGTLPLGFYEMS